MKADELMINDWVQIPCLIDNTENYNAWCQIKQLRDGDLDVIGFKELSYDEICPISLTTDILEKNGFKIDKYGQMVLDEELGTSEVYIVLQDGDECYWWVVNNELIAKIRYVHQLQHALRLSGIKKEIEL